MGLLSSRQCSRRRNNSQRQNVSHCRKHIESLHTLYNGLIQFLYEFTDIVNDIQVVHESLAKSIGTFDSNHPQGNSVNQIKEMLSVFKNANTILRPQIDSIMKSLISHTESTGHLQTVLHSRANAKKNVNSLLENAGNSNYPEQSRQQIRYGDVSRPLKSESKEAFVKATDVFYKKDMEAKECLKEFDRNYLPVSLHLGKVLNASLGYFNKISTNISGLHPILHQLKVESLSHSAMISDSEDQTGHSQKKEIQSSNLTIIPSNNTQKSLKSSASFSGLWSKNSSQHTRLTEPPMDGKPLPCNNSPNGRRDSFTSKDDSSSISHANSTSSKKKDNMTIRRDLSSSFPKQWPPTRNLGVREPNFPSDVPDFPSCNRDNRAKMDIAFLKFPDDSFYD